MVFPRLNLTETLILAVLIIPAIILYAAGQYETGAYFALAGFVFLLFIMATQSFPVFLRVGESGDGKETGGDTTASNGPVYHDRTQRRHRHSRRK